MTDSSANRDPIASGDTPLPMADKLVFCKRVGRDLPVVEHKECPYCFGHTRDVATGDHGEFCDFRPGTDPVTFGLRTDDVRHLRG